MRTTIKVTAEHIITGLIIEWAESVGLNPTLKSLEHQSPDACAFTMVILEGDERLRARCAMGSLAIQHFSSAVDDDPARDAIIIQLTRVVAWSYSNREGSHEVV